MRSAARLLLGATVALGFTGGAFRALADGWEVHFSPKGGCTDAVVRELAAARTSVFVQAYSFTSAPIARALVDAKERGVDVQVILDKSNRKAHYSAADFLIHHGVPTRIDAAHAIAHNKVMIVDGQVVVTGSFNFTTAAEEHNAENLLVVHDPRLAAEYLRNWKVHALHSPLYKPEAQPNEGGDATFSNTARGR